MKGDAETALNSRIDVLATPSASRINNSQPPGVGRLSIFGEHIVINNLGRNIAVCRLEENSLESVAIHDLTAFPRDDESSQFDLDMHSFMKVPNADQLLAINHYGLVRLFEDWQLSSRPNCFFWAGDVERFIWFKDFLISTSPRGYRSNDNAVPGILASCTPMKTGLSCGTNPDLKQIGEFSAQAIPRRQMLPDWGFTTALAVDAQTPLIFVAAGSRLGAFLPAISQRGLEFEKIWEAQANFHISAIRTLPEQSALLACGFAIQESNTDLVDWTNLKGGGFSLVQIKDGSVLANHHFSADLAWGNGGCPVALDRAARGIVGVDRFAHFYRWDFDGSCIMLGEPAQPVTESMGIAHLLRTGNRFLCGFNRGGLRVFSGRF